MVVGAGAIVIGTETGTTTGVEGAETVTAGTTGAWVAAGAGVGVEGTAGAAAGAEVEAETVDWLDETLLVWLVCDMVLLAVGAEITVLVETLEEVTDPCTHLPFDKIRPNLLEQVLQATPPSL